MRVKEIMEKKVITVKQATSLKELLKIFAKFHLFPLVPVVDDDNRLIGLIFFKSLISALMPAEPELLKTVPFIDEKKGDIFDIELSEDIGSLVVAEDIMERKFITINEDASLEEAYKLMHLHLKEELPVVDKNGKLVGILGVFDIIRQVFRQKGIL